MKLSQMLPFIIPLVLIHYTLAVIALVNLIKKKKVRFNNKFIWGVIIFVFEIIGPVVYFLANGDEE
ncbi:MAG: PLDc N-terminal domain-containing protein [Bacillota bacterium]|nr:PLDc N-terminal domain-containing protein [Bacillota bacterium]